MDDFILLSTSKPEKFQHVLVIDDKGIEYNAYRCGCDGTDWSETVSGNKLYINVVKWKKK